jgi:U3 small nucleolar RNA-associated protein 10
LVFFLAAFWRDDRLQQVTTVLIALIAVPGTDQDTQLPRGGIAKNGGSKETVLCCLVALCGAATDDALLKRLNLDVLMHTRADDAHVRIFALQCARALWTAHGSKLIGAWGMNKYSPAWCFTDGGSLCAFLLLPGFVAETATFIAECAEDEHDGVVSETHALKATIEGSTGERIRGL